MPPLSPIVPIPPSRPCCVFVQPAACAATSQGLSHRRWREETARSPADAMAARRRRSLPGRRPVFSSPHCLRCTLVRSITTCEFGLRTDVQPCAPHKPLCTPPDVACRLSCLPVLTACTLCLPCCEVDFKNISSRWERLDRCGNHQANLLHMATVSDR